MNSSVPLAPCKYRTGKTLGQGTYAVVKEVFHIESGKKYAAKVLNKKLMRGREHMARNEINVLTKVSKGHSNIITLVDYFETANNLYLVMDLATGGELFDRICILGSFYEDKAAELVKTIVQAVAHLHKEGIVHRDLKPENLLFETDSDDSPLLIADFGLSKIINPEDFYMLTTLCGTPGYMAPEIYLKKGHGQPVDMWAIGVITYFLLNGSPPFDHPTNKDQMQAIIDAKYSFEPKEYWDPISQIAKDFISKCLVSDPEKRMTAEEALAHAWLKEPGDQTDEVPTQQDLLPNVRRKLSTRKKSLRKIVNAVRTVNYMKQIQEALPLDEDITNQDVLHAH